MNNRSRPARRRDGFWHGTSYPGVADWLGGLEAEILSMLDDYAAVVVQDTPDLWSHWPTKTL
jgi:hypothetical protein